MNRRKFLIGSTLTAAGTLVGANAVASAPPSKPQGIKFGLCTDVHLDTVHDAPQRLEAFIQEMQQKQPDFIIQTGDFCSPREKNNAFMSIWKRFSGPRYGVLGNHDTDGNFTRQQAAAFMEMPACYYSFDVKGYHFIVLDANEAEFQRDRNPNTKYVAYIGDQQLDWLEADLDKTDKPVIVFVHQGLDNDLQGVENAVKVRALLDRCNKKAKRQKVQMVFSGHHHQDYHNVINGIHYIQINSMSYQWMGKPYENKVYTEEINAKFPWTKYTAPYKDPLWAFVEIFPDQRIRITGKKSVFVGKSPVELGRKQYSHNGYPEVPYISDREIRLDI